MQIFIQMEIMLPQKFRGLLEMPNVSVNKKNVRNHGKPSKHRRQLISNTKRIYIYDDYSYFIKIIVLLNFHIRCKILSVRASCVIPQRVPTNMADDEIIRKRLLIDGEGVGDDRRITTLLKTFLKWCNNDEEKDPSYQKMFAQLAQCEFTMGKTQAVYEMNERETANYEKSYKEIEESISNAYGEIAECKNELQQAKRIRRNRQEYDALAQGIAKHPERQETMRQIEELEKVLTQQTETKESLATKLELRKKQFYLLIKTIHELQLMIDEDKTDQDSHFSSEVASIPSSGKATPVDSSSEKTTTMDTS